MKKSYHSIVVPTALASATRRDSDVGPVVNVMYHRGAYHATRQVSPRFHAQCHPWLDLRSCACARSLRPRGLWYCDLEDRAGHRWDAVVRHGWQEGFVERGLQSGA